MAYSELIKSFENIRDYLREFYVYGFKSREEYTLKSARSYDDERRRMESWLGEYMRFRQTPDGKIVFLSIDSRLSRHNPLYRAWKTKSFTDGDITLHFLLMDILHSSREALSFLEILRLTDERLRSFDEPRLFDESTVRKKLSSYAGEGILVKEKRGKETYYRRAEDAPLPDADTLDFFSEVAPCGVIGSFLLDKTDIPAEHMAFKHHYITSAMDSEILCALFDAMRGKMSVTLETVNRRRERMTQAHVVPLRAMISVQSGRQYLMAYFPRRGRFSAVRVDCILSVRAEAAYAGFDALRGRLDAMTPHLWGICTRGGLEKPEHVEFTVRYAADEQHIHERLLREKRCGTVEKIDENTSRFSADVYDANEMIPWIRTFICRITDICFSDPLLEERFKNDLKAMYRMYGLEGGDGK